MRWEKREVGRSHVMFLTPIHTYTHTQRPHVLWFHLHRSVPEQADLQREKGAQWWPEPERDRGVGLMVKGVQGFLRGMKWFQDWLQRWLPWTVHFKWMNSLLCKFYFNTAILQWGTKISKKNPAKLRWIHLSLNAHKLQPVRSSTPHLYICDTKYHLRMWSEGHVSSGHLTLS